MPEIKHQFTGGKMNKDLDERLVPNGEYRDALNVEVSTSEDSDVGTVQNILGNSLVPGQNFIGENAVCVGSIADEKNDKLYYFITQRELLSNGGFDNNGSGWLDVSQHWNLSNNQATGLATGTGYMHSRAPGVVEGNMYTITYDVVVASTAGGITLANHSFIGGINTNGTDNNVHLTNENTIGTHTLEWEQGPSPTRRDNIWLYKTSTYNGTIDNVSVFRSDIARSCIVEYDSTTNTITPVLVDMVGDVLKFNQDNIITGINIIDDLLFWTDNENEPKKINIQRSIDGTDASGIVHTTFENDKRTDVSGGPIREEHITVIKKAPKLAPKIELISERNPTSTYSGVMRITTAPTQPLIPRGSVSGGNNNITNAQNPSSMWLDAASWYNHHHDFTSIAVGKKFDTQIETKLDGTSGFVLDWEIGDIILFKEFEGDNYDEVPSTPITDYSVKAKIVEASPYPILTDEITEVAQNGDFSIPSSNGTAPNNWSLFGSAAHPITYLQTTNSIQFDTTTWKKVIQATPATPIEVNVNYNVSIELSGVMAGGVNVYMIFDDPNSNGWFTINSSLLSSNGIHTFTLTTSGETSGNSNTWGSHVGRIVIQSNETAGGFDGVVENISIIRPAQNAAIRCKVLAINNPPLAPESLGELRFAVDRLDTQEKLFEFKFPRFAYRYQYEDREYSTMSPFSQIAFLPGSFDYHPKKGYNLGMTNRVTSINIKNFVASAPDGVIAIDILYKEDSSPNVYVVDTIKPKHNPLSGASNIWDKNAFVVTSEQISQMLPSNQLLRLWDNVPKKALAQDVSGNRIIYGNYTQGFDLKAGDVNASEEYYPDFNFNIIHNNTTSLNPKKSIKSLREYQLGVVFVDEYGRETPVISNKSGTYKLDKPEATKKNEIEVSFGNTKFPENMKYFKFFIKETSGEYYNLAMDRYYDAEDGQIWLSFPSSDRNKLDIDTFLILKKGVESNEMVSAAAKYKVLDIQSEAPDFIKQDKQLIEEKTHVFLTDNIFGNSLIDAPLQSGDFFKMSYNIFHGSTGSNLHEIKDSDLYIEFSNTSNNVSKRYRITKLTTDYAVGQPSPVLDDSKYSVKLDKKLGDDVDFITDDDSGLSPSKIDDGTVVKIYKYTKENSSKFDGRFFVKINTDSTFNENIIVESADSTKYRTVLSKKLYYMHPDKHEDLHDNQLTGQNKGVYNRGFGSFAPFFRNYDTAPGDVQDTHGTTDEDIGQYKFGSGSNWLKELAWVTTAGNSDGLNRGIDSGNSNTWPGVKVADSHGWSSSDRNGVFNEAEEQEKGEVWFIDEGPYYGSRSNDNLHWATGGSRWINPGYTPPLGISTTTINGEQFGILEIAIGGIYDSQEQEDDGGSISEFFNIGRPGGNTNYDSGNNAALVSKLFPGQKFRFREDPSEEIYTIQPGMSDARRARWETIHPSGEPFSDSSPSTGSGVQANHFSFDWYNPWGNTGWTQTFPSSNYDNDSTDLKVYSIQLSPNLTRGWKPKFLNSSGGSSVAWDPTGDPGPIDNGLELAIQHSSAANKWTIANDQPYVGVDSLFATDQVTGKTHAITTGMILTSHSDDGTPVTYAATYSLGSTGQKNPLAIKSIEGTGPYQLYLSGYVMPLRKIGLGSVAPAHDIFTTTPTAGEEMIFKQPKMNGYSQYSVNRINAQHGITNGGIMAIGYNLEFVEAIESEPIMPSNPAIWETEPKESTDLDIYYEASGLNPLRLELGTINTAIPIGSTVEHLGNDSSIVLGTTISGVGFTPFNNPLNTPAESGWFFTVTPPDAVSANLPLVDSSYIVANSLLKITKPDGSAITVEVTGWDVNNVVGNRVDTIYIKGTLYNSNTTYTLNWHNCYSFGNGVESNRIRDNFNLPFISNGVKVSTTLEEGLGEEHRKYGLIYSGIYNSNSSTNNLNQFIQAEKITKDVNPIYGSIQKLHSRDSDLVTLCEDKCLRIMANKDAVFNADGNTNLTATNRVLGQTMPFSGEFGISTNPESFASESYRVYFTDKIRGTVMRLSKDGLTPISMYGMKDWFKDNLKLSTKLIGSYDDRKDEYNITLADRKTLGEELIVNGNFKTDYIEWFGNTSHWSWDSVNENLFSDGNPHARIGQDLSGSLSLGKTYQISFTVGEALSSTLEGRLWVTLHDDNANYKTLPISPYYYTTVGIYTQTITVDNTWAPYTWGVLDNHPNSINFHIKEATTNDGVWFNGTIDNISVKEIISDPITVSFKEDVKGWVSFKSFVLENGVSTANDYYTMLGGKLYKHHIENTNRNNFYGVDYNSSVNVILNDGPGSVKSFHTLDYEGSQSRIIQNLQDNDYYNLTPKDGWFVSGIETNKQVGSINEFIEKEGKWFNYIKGVDSDITSDTDFGAFDIQGIGFLKQTITSDNSQQYKDDNFTTGGSISQIESFGWDWMNNVMEFDGAINTSLQIGDIIYYQQAINTTTLGGYDIINQNEIIKFGQVTEITSNTVTMDETVFGATNIPDPTHGAFILFAKNHIVNTSSLVGYFADVKFENNSTGKIELFSVGSEITESSK